MKIERFEDIDPSASQARRAGRGLAEICEGLRAYEEINATNREP